MLKTQIVIKMEDLKINSFDGSSIVIASESEEKEKFEPLEGRKLRKRLTTDIHRTQNKAIKKKKDISGSFKSDKDTKKFYLNINKNIKLKPVLLETIFEEEDEEHIQEVQLGKAAKRTLMIKDGHKNSTSKALINKRKSQIKKKFGRRKRPKKVALKSFIEDFKKKTND